MQIKRENLAKSRVKLVIAVSKAEIQPYFERTYQKLSQEAKIKGFRPGKAPKLMVIEAVGLNRYNSTALDLLLPHFYSQAVKQEKIVPINSPAISLEKFAEDEDFIFTAEVDVRPEIKLGKYQNIRINPSTTLGAGNKELRIKHEVSTEEVEKVIKRLLYQAAQFTEVERSAQSGDFVEINYEGSIKGVKQENLINKNFPLILGEKVLLPGFEEKLTGMKKGEEKRFELEMDHKYTDPANITNKKSHRDKIEFNVKMNMVKEVKLPELNEDFAKKFGHKDSESLKKAIAESIKQEKEQQARAALQQDILEKIAAKTILEIPESLVEQEISLKIEAMQKQFGPVWPQYLEKMNKTIEDLRKELRAGAEKQVKFSLILGEVARDMGFRTELAKTAKEKLEIVKKTMEKLVEMATK